MMSGNAPTVAVCWQVTKNNGAGYVRGTQHDADITIASGLYAGTYSARAGVSGSDVKGRSDLSADNLNVDGAVTNPTDVTTVDVTHADILADNFAYAPVVVFAVDWTNPNDYQHVMAWGTLGEIIEESTGHYSTEVRGPMQAFQQQIVRTQGDRCDIPHLGHGQCQFNIAANTVTGAVVTVTDRKHFTVSGIGTPAWSYSLGLLKFTSGENNGFSREVKLDPRENGGVLLVFDELPNNIGVGDTFTLEPGCPRTIDACKVFGQVLNFQGYGLYVPGIDAYMKGPL
jgi:uncharacterized phage protein (TIGR02218 family)